MAVLFRDKHHAKQTLSFHLLVKGFKVDTFFGAQFSKKAEEIKWPEKAIHFAVSLLQSKEWEGSPSALSFELQPSKG